MHTLARKVTAAAWSAFSSKQQNLSLGGESLMMQGDESLLETLLQNLLDNANEYTPTGGEVVVTVSEPGGKPRLVVEDSGPGISAQEQALVFERFYRTSDPAAARETASGLGLAICFIIAVSAKTPVFEIEIRDHLFQPEELRIPANTKIKLIVYNRDSTPEEFESYELNREKVIMGGRKANVFIGPLAPGVYPFFGEFNPKTAQGRVIAE